MTLAERQQQAAQAIAQAIASRADEEHQQRFARLTAEVNSVISGLTLLEVLATPELAVQDDQRTDVREACARLAGLASQLREEVGADPDAVRKSATWKLLLETGRSTTSMLASALQQALEDLVRRAPSPRLGATANLPPGNPLATRYGAASHSYHRTKAELNDGRSIAAFLRVTKELERLEAEIESHAVPEMHQGQWRLLVQGRLKASDMPAEFLDWLRDEGHAARVILRFDDG